MEYANDTVYLEKVKDLSVKYRYIRRTRPDGNCFFRAFSYANIERLIGTPNDFEQFYKMVESSKNSLVELGFPQFTVEDFYDTVIIICYIVFKSIINCYLQYMDVLQRIKDVNSIEGAKSELHHLFNEQGYSDYMVVYLRLLTSGQLQKDQDFYSCFIEGGRTVYISRKIFCHIRVCDKFFNYRW